MNQQARQVLARLKRQSLSQLEALDMGIYRLAARVCELRQQGHEITTVMEEHHGGKHARYFLRRRA